MSATASPYHRLPGRSFGLFQSHTLWRGDDHLLLVQTMPGGESYRRFYYRDIEAIVVRPTRVRLWVNVVLLLTAALSFLSVLLVYLGNPAHAGIVWMSLGGAFWLVLAGINTARGPTDEVRIQTAVQFERIPSLGRRRHAQRVLGQLRPLILADQGTEENPEGAGSSSA